MRIMYVSDTLALWGGIERILSCKSQELSNRYGYQFCFVTTNQGGHPLPFELPRQASHVDLDIGFHQQYRYGLLKRLIFLRQMRRLCQERLARVMDSFRPDVVVLVTLSLASVVSRATKNVPFVFESHSSFYSDKFDRNGWLTRLNGWFNKCRLRHADAIVALTEGDALNWRRVNPRVFVIPNMVCLNDAGIYSDCTSSHVIFVGRFTKQKGIGSLMDIWQIVHLRHPEWHLDLYGDGELKDDFIHQAALMDANIHIHAPVSDIFRCYRESSVHVMTSVYEPFGLVLPEAMSCGLPVVAFDCPYGPSQIVSDGVDGFLVPGRNISLFADRLSLLLSSLELRQKMGRAAVLSAQRYAPEKVIPLWKSLFEKLKAGSL